MIFVKRFHQYYLYLYKCFKDEVLYIRVRRIVSLSKKLENNSALVSWTFMSLIQQLIDIVKHYFHPMHGICHQRIMISKKNYNLNILYTDFSMLEFHMYS